jgi:hypothetical protein
MSTCTYRLGIDGVFPILPITAIVARTLYKLEQNGYNNALPARPELAELRACNAGE